MHCTANVTARPVDGRYAPAEDRGHLLHGRDGRPFAVSSSVGLFGEHTHRYISNREVQEYEACRGLNYALTLFLLLFDRAKSGSSCADGVCKKKSGGTRKKSEENHLPVPCEGLRESNFLFAARIRAFFRGAHRVHRVDWVRLIVTNSTGEVGAIPIARLPRTALDVFFVRWIGRAAVCDLFSSEHDLQHRLFD